MSPQCRRTSALPNGVPPSPANAPRRAPAGFAPGPGRPGWTRALFDLGLPVAIAILGIPAPARAQAGVTPVNAAPAGDTALGQAVGEALALTRSGVRLPTGARLEVVAGQLDPRLQLAPCRKVEPYLPNGAPPWGRTRVGLRCANGPVPWNVYLPVTVKVWAPAVVTRHAVAAGAALSEADLTVAEVDIAAEPQPTFGQAQELSGRTLAAHLSPGTAVRSHHLRQRSWFQAGEQISVLASGPGFGVTLSGQAMSQGLEGQPVRVRTESGRILTAWPVAENRAELR